MHDEHAIANQEDVASEPEARASEAVDKLADPKNVELSESTDVMGERERFARKTVLMDAHTNNLEHRSVHVGVDYWRLTSFVYAKDLAGERGVRDVECTVSSTGRM